MASTFADAAKQDSRRRLGLCVDRPAYLANLCSSADMVAHLGCTDSPFTEDRLCKGLLLHERLLSVGSHVVGIDVDSHALSALSKRFPDARFCCVDYSRGVPADHVGAFDLVLVPEVLEHIPDPPRLLAGCRRTLKDGGRLCVTVPNACSPKPTLRALAGYEIVHPDHFCYYSPRTIEHLLRFSGFTVTEALTYLSYEPTPAGRLFNSILRGVHLIRGGPVGDGLIVLATAQRG